MTTHPSSIRLSGKSLIKYRHALLAEIKEAEGEMEHASMRLGWGRKWYAKAKSDLLKAGRKRGVALERHWVTIGVESMKVKR